MVYCFDLDGTICSLTENNEYPSAIPMTDMVEAINKLSQNHRILIFTARGASSGINWEELTTTQLKEWGVQYNELIMGQKPSFDIMIDDKAVNAVVWRQNNTTKRTGVIAGSFDVIHPGYLKMFKDAKTHCNYLTICLHRDPSLYGKNKISPLLTADERIEVLSSIKYIDEIITYDTEEDLEDILRNNAYDVRIVGSDYFNKPITGPESASETIFHNRDHEWSTTKYKKLIYENYKTYLEG